MTLPVSGFLRVHEALVPVTTKPAIRLFEVTKMS
jgi:hypothetical protein